MAANPVADTLAAPITPDGSTPDASTPVIATPPPTAEPSAAARRQPFGLLPAIGGA